jgi:signal transduction histidine kinase
LHRQGSVVGALTLYTPELGTFDTEHVKLLESLCADISYALDAMQEEKRRSEAEETLRHRTLELQQLTETLEMRVQERTEELKTINEELRAENEERLRIEIDLRESENRLRELSMALLNAQERERKLIAGEIHDSMGASLAATKFKVDTALKEMGEGNPQAKAALESVVPIIQGTIEEARRIQMSLRPSMLDDLGILATINWFCRQFESTYSNIHVKREIDIQEQEVPESLKIVIYRVLQEALNNIAKHSKAPVVLLLLQKANQAIQLVIRDSGEGFDLEEVSSRKGTAKGLGLDSMRERAELSGGSFLIESSKGAGTVIRATWPIEQPPS